MLPVGAWEQAEKPRDDLNFLPRGLEISAAQHGPSETHSASVSPAVSFRQDLPLSLQEMPLFHTKCSSICCRQSLLEISCSTYWRKNNVEIE